MPTCSRPPSSPRTGRERPAPRRTDRPLRADRQLRTCSPRSARLLRRVPRPAPDSTALLEFLITISSAVEPTRCSDQPRTPTTIHPCRAAQGRRFLATYDTDLGRRQVGACGGFHPSACSSRSGTSSRSRPRARRVSGEDAPRGAMRTAAPLWRPTDLRRLAPPLPRTASRPWAGHTRKLGHPPERDATVGARPSRNPHTGL